MQLQARVFLLLAASLLCGGCKKDASQIYEAAFKKPVGFVYTRPEASHVTIPIYTESEGLNNVLKTTMVELLNQLPLAHVGLLQRIATLPMGLGTANVAGAVAYEAAGRYLPDSRSIILNTGDVTLRSPLEFRKSLAHEIAHAVQLQMLSQKENDAWIALSKKSIDSRDYISWTAENGTSAPEKVGDDFAETYAYWARDSNWQLFRAANLAQEGRPLLLQKLLFTAATYANADGSVTMFREDANQNSQPFRQEAARMSDSLMLGNYIYWLNGRNITKITDRDGRVILDNVWIAVPQIVFDRIPLTPSSQTARLQTTTPPGTALFTAGSQVISPNTPHHYTPVMSKEGSASLASEQALANPQHRLTLEDQIRPHGNFSITSTQTPR
jgi:hypothetical protein